MSATSRGGSAIGSLLSRAGLSFDDQSVERGYTHHSMEQALPILRAGILLATATFALFGLTDLASDVGGVVSTRFRYMVACPIMLCFLAMTYPGPARRHVQALTSAFALVAGGLVAVAVLLLDGETSFKIAQGNATPNFMLATAFLALLPLATLNVLCIGLVFQALHAVVLIRSDAFDFQHVAISLGFVNSTFVIACCATFWRERLMRIAFAEKQVVMRERETTQAQLLSFMSLETISRVTDPSKSVADVFGEVTVLFCDLIGFTQLAERLAPKHLVELLTAIFSRLDELAAEFGVEKVKTIGDAYMAVTGATDHPANRRDRNPAEDMADFALSVQREAAHFSTEFGYPIRFRMGMHTGSLIGGIIGKNKRSYDYWGRTVNVASRLEATAAEGCIQVSEATFYRLHRTYRLEPRGEINLKGIGATQAYTLIERLEPGTVPADG